jgi:type IX secretion system PorP/SprF family membrane protein
MPVILKDYDYKIFILMINKIINTMKKQIICLIAIVPCLVFTLQSIAQLNPFSTGYFQNQYLLNPAMSGVKAKQGALAATYSRQGNIPNSPVSMALTGNYGFSEDVSAGINVFYDVAGIQNTVKIMGTYNYSIQLDDQDNRLYFGLSAGGLQQRLNNKDVYGDPNDPVIYNYNDQSMKFESDFGMAYVGKKLTVQAAFPNMVSYFSNYERNVANRATFFSAVSYRLAADEEDDGITIEPKIVFRGVAGNDNIIDAGANVTILKDMVNFFGMYHSSKSLTVGAGIRIMDMAQVTLVYNTQSSDLKSYSSGAFEVGLRFLFK